MVHRSVRVLAQRGLVLLLALVTVLALAPVSAQEDAPPVLILPINKANFLPGAMFDVRVEVHTETMPENFAMTINGEAAADFFGAEGTAENWVFGAEDDGTGGTPSQAMTWRSVTLPEAGEYVVEVTAGDTTSSVTWTALEPTEGAGARNVILIVGDGMSLPMITAARLASRGISDGKLDGQFAMDQMEEIGLVHTNSVNSIMADSANTASAMNTGHKGSVNATGTYSDTSPDTLDDPRVETFAQIIRRTRGMSVGIVTTSDFTDATPASVWAHGRDRSSGNRAEYAAQALEMEPEVIMGGGGQYLIPQSVEGSRRSDDRDLFTEFEEAGYTIATTAAELTDVMGETPERLMGIFHQRDMNVWLDRNVYTDNLGDFPDQPGLVDMSLAAVEVLNQNPNGFYLLIEGASIDKQMHPLDQERSLSDLIELDNTLAALIEWTSANAPDTLIVVTADHGHGYDVYGTVDVAAFNEATDDLGRREAIRVYGGAGYPTYEDADGDGVPNWDTDIVFAGVVNNHPDYTEDFQVSETPRVPAIQDEATGNYVDNPDDDPNGIVMSGNLAPSDSTGVHTLQDVPVFASGPGAAFYGRAMEQSDIFFGLAGAIGLDPRVAMTEMEGMEEPMMATEEAMAAEATEIIPEATVEATEAAGVLLPENLSGIALLVVGLLGGLALSGLRRK